MRTSQTVVFLAVTAAAVAALIPPGHAGSFDPYRLERIQRQATAGLRRQGMAAGVAIRLPFQTAGHSPLVETEYRLQLGLRSVPVTGMASLRMGGLGRPLARLSIRGTDPGSLAINGVSLREWGMLAAGEEEGEEAHGRSRRKHHRVWWWVGGGVVFLGLVTAGAAAAAASAGKAAGRALACVFNPDPDCPSSGP